MNKALWFQLYEKIKGNDEALREACTILWDVAMEQATFKDVRAFFVAALDIQMDDES